MIEEVVVAPPKSHEIRIRVICSSLCSSDTTFWKSHEPPLGHFPRILGHEAVGVVESLGEGVVEVSVGDLVIPTFLAECGECGDCRSTKSNQCSKFPFKISPWMHRDGTSRFSDINGETIYHFIYVSSFSEYTVVDITHVAKIDAKIPPNRACLLSYGVATGVGGAWKAADVEPGSTVAIFGLGVIGLAVAEGARIRGAKKIIGVDLNPEKFEIGKRFGITDFVMNSNKRGSSKSLSEVINEMTEGGADHCFECVGLPDLMQEALACCRKGWGKTIMLGVEAPGLQMNVSSVVIDHSGKTLMGTLFGSLKPKLDIPMLAKSYLNKELQLDGFVTNEMEFEDINKALDLVRQGKTLRCVIWMDKQLK